jgi:hypothetical protein
VEAEPKPERSDRRSFSVVAVDQQDGEHPTRSMKDSLAGEAPTGSLAFEPQERGPQEGGRRGSLAGGGSRRGSQSGL